MPLWQLLGSQFGQLILAVGFLGFAALYVSASWLEARGTGHYGITTEVAALLTLIMILAQALRHWFGQLGVYLLATVAGLSDVDAIAVSLSRMAPEELALVAAAGAITVAALVNTVVKG